MFNRASHAARRYCIGYTYTFILFTIIMMRIITITIIINVKCKVIPVINYIIKQQVIDA
jgi:hypothetical protein